METKVWSDFGGGWSGTLDLAKVPENMYDARNILLYRDGSLGPRPGLKQFNIGRTITGPVRAIVHAVNNSPKGIIYVDDTSVYGVSDSGNGAYVLKGTINGGSDPDTLPAYLWRYSNTSVYLHIPETFGPAMYLIDTVGNTVTQYTDIFSSYCGTVYGVRYVTGHSNENKIIYSEANNVTSHWPDNNFIDLQSLTETWGYTPIYLTVQKNNLVIVDAGSRFLVLSGVPGVNDTLRLVNNSPIRPEPIAFRSFIDTDDDLIYFLAPARNTPAMFDGVSVKELQYLSMTPEDLGGYAEGNADFSIAHSSVMGFTGIDGNSPGWILTTHNRMLLMHLGVWGLHEFGLGLHHAWTSDGRGRLFGFGTSGLCYSTDLRLNRPAFVTDQFASPGDGTTTPVDAYIKFPEVWSDDGDLLEPSEIIVDFTKWNTGAPVDNRIQLTLESMGMAPDSNVGTRTTTREWTESGATATTTGVKDRIRWNVGDYSGAGFSVKLGGLRGVAIRQVRVNYNRIKSDGRYR